MKKIVFITLAALLLLACKKTEKEEVMEAKCEKECGVNKVVENIMNRRSIRSYKPEQIAEGQLDAIIKCGINAPSALNKQPWEVRVIQNADLLNRINAKFVEGAKEKNLPGSASRAAEEGFSVFHGAPTLIVVAKDKNNAYSGVDCGLLAQNILLSAESMDIGTCVVGSVAGLLNSAEGKAFLEEIKLPETHDVAFTIAIGYKNESPEAKERDANKVQYIK